MAEAAKKLSPGEIIKAIDKLTPSERETFAILCDKKLADEVRKARKEAKEEHKKGLLLSHKKVFSS